MSHSSTDELNRNLLLGILAFQVDFISRKQLLAAYATWLSDKSLVFEEVLVEEGKLARGALELLKPLVNQHIADHNGNANESLAALSSIQDIARDLGNLGDEQIDVTMSLAVSGEEKEAQHATVNPASSLATGGDLDARTDAANRFRLIELHAKGGLGAVSVAEDLELNRKVALKEIQARFADDEGSRSRFLLEAEVTGGLEHPGIVPVYGLGKYPDGRPFYAMRFIRGDSLKESAGAFHGHGRGAAEPANMPQGGAPAAPDFESVTFRKLLGRFVDVCQAVEYAHSRGVLHRDLKPGNIMLGKYGETLVVDWGLAKTQDQPSEEMAGESFLQPTSASGSSATVMGSAIGTPAFMPPEQAAGDLDNLGPASDVYSLGATLYYMLTGHAPFQGSVSTVIDNVRAGHFVSPRNVQAAVPKPLEAICLKAMMTSSSDRYGSPIDLADDIERYLADEPVSVLVEPWDVRLRRWLRKHQALATSSAAVVLVLIIALGVFSSVVSGKNAQLTELNSTLIDEKARTTEALDQVTEEQKKTLAALDDLKASRARNLQNLRHVTKKLVPGLISRKQKISESDRSFVRGLLPMWQEVASARGNTAAAIRLRGEAQFAVANLLGSLGQYTEACQGYREALKTYKQLDNTLPGNAASLRAVARTHNNLGNTLTNLGETTEALDQMRAAQAIQARLAAEFPDEPTHQRDLATMHSNVGTQLTNLGTDLKGSVEEFASAQAILQHLTKEFPDEPAYSSALAITHLNLGNLFHRLGKIRETLAQYRTAANLYEGLTGRHPSHIEYRRNFAHIQTNLGTVLSETGQLAEAEKQLRGALDARAKLATEFPAISEYRSQLISSHGNLAVLFAAAGKPAEAEKHHELALGLLTALLQQSPGTPMYRALLASTHDNLALVIGDIKRADRDPAAAEEHHRTAIALWDKLRNEFPDVPKYTSEAAATRNHLGLLLFRSGRHDAADEQYRQALSVMEEMVVKFPDMTQFQIDLAASCCNFGKLIVTRGKPGEGLKWLDKAIGLMKMRVQSESKDLRARKFLRNSYWVRAEAYDKLGRTTAANADWNEAIKLSPRRELFILRAKRADSRARAGLAREAVEDIDAIASIAAWPPANLYSFAVVYTIASNKVDDNDRKKQYEDKAVSMLQRAIKAGWKDANRIATDPDLAPLRERDDFKKLLADLKP